MTIRYLSDIRKVPASERRVLLRILSGGHAVTVQDVLSADAELTEDEIQQFTAIIGHRCATRTQNTIRWRLAHLDGIGCDSSLGRLHINTMASGKVLCDYCAGQSYPDEIRRLRQWLIGGKR